MVLVGVKNPEENAARPKGARHAPNGNEVGSPYLAEGENQDPEPN
jgi:hypothetical protein